MICFCLNISVKINKILEYFINEQFRSILEKLDFINCRKEKINLGSFLDFEKWFWIDSYYQPDGLLNPEPNSASIPAKWINSGSLQ